MSTPIKTEDSIFVCHCSSVNNKIHEQITQECVELMLGGLGKLAGSFMLCDKAALVILARMTAKVMQSADPSIRDKLEEQYTLLLEVEYGIKR